MTYKSRCCNAISSGVDFINRFARLFFTGREDFFGAQIGVIANSIWQKVRQFKLEIWSFNH